MEELLKNDIDYIKQRLVEILEQTKMTNGRVSKHETEIAVMQTHLADTRIQIAELKAKLLLEEQKAEKQKTEFLSMGWKLLLAVLGSAGITSILWKLLGAQ